MKELIEKIEQKADSIGTKSDIDRRAKGVYIDCLLMIKDSVKSEETKLNFHEWIKQVSEIDVSQSYLLDNDEIFEWNNWYQEGMSPKDAVRFNEYFYGI